MSIEDRILAMTENQLQANVPPLMRDQGFTEEEIHRAMQIFFEFRQQHRIPVIE